MSKLLGTLFSLSVTLLLHATLISSTKCKSVSFVGTTISDLKLKSGVSTHFSYCLVLWGDRYTIKVAGKGYLLGWTVYQNWASQYGLFLDVWRLGSDEYFQLVHKTELDTTEKRNYTVALKVDAPVKDGDAIGIHKKPYKSIGTAYTTAVSATEYPYSGLNFDDLNIKAIKKEAPSSVGRMQALGAYVLDDRTALGGDCSMTYKRMWSITKFRAIRYSTTVEQSLPTCALMSTRLAPSMTFTYKKETRECKLYSRLWSNDSDVAEVQLQAGEWLFISN